MNCRLQNIDIAKGLTICLMVIGHSSIPAWLSNWIWSFHMPFFFFVSGLLTSWDKNFKVFSIGKTKTLLLPFIIYSFINILLYPLYGDDLKEFVRQVLFHGWGGYALWFIPVLYFSLIFCKIIPNKVWSNWVSLVCFLLIGGGLSAFHIEIPWTLSTVPIACAYILIARLFKTSVLILLYSKKLLLFLVLGIVGLGVSLFISSHYRLDLAWNSILPIIPLLTAAISGTIAILCVSELILFFPKFAHLWMRIGTHTMEILALSQCIILIVNRNLSISPLIKYLILVLILYVVIKLKDKIKEFSYAN